jgi:MoaA/NifB/PqqE/SkfB family radical SAM enzyme
MCITVSGNWRPCCRFDESLLPWDKKFKIDKFTFEEWRNSDFYQDIIEQQKTGWHKGCEKCRKSEETGNRSMRKVFDDLVSGEGNDIEFIEISLSRECNLACRMCGPFASSTWQKLVVENEQDLKDFYKPQLEQAPADVEKLFSGLDLTKINRIKLLGGEPFITPQTSDFFEYLESNNLLDNIDFMTNTNVTFFPKKLVKYLSKLKRANISFSIDGFGKNNDYVRHKSTWSKVLEVTDKWKDFSKSANGQINLSTSTCVNVYNVHQIDDIVNWSIEQELNDYYFNIISGPKQLKLEALPPAYVEEILEKLHNNELVKGVSTYLQKMQHDPDLLNLLVEYTKRMDRITGLNLKDYNPRLAKHLKMEE